MKKLSFAPVLVSMFLVGCSDQQEPCATVALCLAVQKRPDITVHKTISLTDFQNLPPETPALVRTVIDGTMPVDLGVRVKGMAVNQLTNAPDDLYLWLETDEDDQRWSTWGGPAAGMSGSPVIVYMQDEWRLAGAMSEVFGPGREQPPYPFLATPIDEMLPLIGIEPETGTGSQPFTIAGSSERVLLLTKSESPSRSLIAYTSNQEDAPNPLLSTSTERVGTAQQAEQIRIEAGSSAGATVMKGSFVIGGAGTVTVVDDDRFLAFGHPFMGLGDVSMPLIAAPIKGIMRDNGKGAQKVFSFTNTVMGRVETDALRGLAGHLGKGPADMIDSKVSVSWEGGTIHLFKGQVSRFPLGSGSNLMNSCWRELAEKAVMMVRQSDGGGSANLELSFMFEDDLTATRSQVISSASDLAGDLGKLVDDQVRKFTKPDYPFDAIARLRSVHLTVFVSSTQRKALLLGYEYDSTTLQKGQLFTVKVKLIPWDSPLMEQQITLDIPMDFPSGSAKIDVKPASDFDAIDTPTPVTLEDAVKAFNGIRTSDQLAVRLTSTVDPVCNGNTCSQCPACDAQTQTCPPCNPCPCELKKAMVEAVVTMPFVINVDDDVTTKTVTVP